MPGHPNFAVSCDNLVVLGEPKAGTRYVRMEGSKWWVVLLLQPLKAPTLSLAAAHWDNAVYFAQPTAQRHTAQLETIAIGNKHTQTHSAAKRFLVGTILFRRPAYFDRVTIRIGESTENKCNNVTT